MRSSKLAVFVVLLLIATPLLAVDTDAEKNADSEKDTDVPVPDKPSKTVIYGYVGDVSNMKNLPLKGVTVKLMDDKRQLIGSCVTDTDGMFEFTYTNGTGTFLSFNLEGYTVRTLPSELNRVEGEINMVYFDHNRMVADTVPDENGRYQITSTVEGGSFVAMHITTAFISGYVSTADGTYIRDAKITLKTSDGQSISGYTDGDGYFQIECIFGSYTMSVSCGGFVSPEERVVVTDNKSIEIVLEEKNHDIFLGMDTPHTWEFISLVFITISIMIFLGIYLRIKKGRSEIAMVNDLELEPEDDEKE